MFGWIKTWRSVEGLLLIPHELLHVLAYRLINKPCRYHLGECWVESLSPLPRRQELFVTLFPLAVTLGISLILYGLTWFTLAYLILPSLTPPIQSYWHDVPRWHFTLVMAAWLTTCYSSVAVKDIANAYRLLFANHQNTFHFTLPESG